MERRKRPVKVRRVWKIHPRTRVKPSAKEYRRARMKRQTRRVLRVEEEGNAT